MPKSYSIGADSIAEGHERVGGDLEQFDICLSDSLRSVTGCGAPVANSPYTRRSYHGWGSRTPIEFQEMFPDDEAWSTPSLATSSAPPRPRSRGLRPHHGGANLDGQKLGFRQCPIREILLS
jgi:hypothetical protein